MRADETGATADHKHVSFDNAPVIHQHEGNVALQATDVDGALPAFP